MANHIQTISSSGVFIVGFTTIKEIFGAGWLCVSRPDTGTPTGRCRGPDLVGVIPGSPNDQVVLCDLAENAGGPRRSPGAAQGSKWGNRVELAEFCDPPKKHNMKDMKREKNGAVTQWGPILRRVFSKHPTCGLLSGKDGVLCRAIHIRR